MRLVKALSPLLTQALEFMQEIEDEFKAGVIDRASAAEMLDAAELTQAFRIKQGTLLAVRGDGADESLFLITDDGLSVHAGEFGDDLHGIMQV